jgi:hypothetical protein
MAFGEWAYLGSCFGYTFVYTLAPSQGLSNFDLAMNETSAKGQQVKCFSSE